MKRKTRLLIVDDHSIFRDGLKAALSAQPDLEVVAEASNGEEALAKTREFLPDIVLMDLTMPKIGGLEATRRIKLELPNTRILVLTMHEEDDYFYSILKAGAAGYFIKGGSFRELLPAIEAVEQGEVFIYPTMAKKLLGGYLRKMGTSQDKEGYDSLTGREHEILRMLADGKSNFDIADFLVISPATVQTHRAHIMRKLGLHSRVDLMKYALRQGFITPDTL